MLTRGDRNRSLARFTGCRFGRAPRTDMPPEPLDGAILFAPSGDAGASRAERPGPWRHVGSLPASGSRRSRRSTTSSTCSRNAGYAALPRIPRAAQGLPYPGRSSEDPGDDPSVRPWSTLTERWPTLPQGPLMARPCSAPEGLSRALGPQTRRVSLTCRGPFHSAGRNTSAWSGIRLPALYTR